MNPHEHYTKHDFFYEHAINQVTVWVDKQFGLLFYSSDESRLGLYI